MKLVALVCVSLLSLASAGVQDEDETAVLKSPFYQHAADFKSQFKSFMSSNPTGRPKDLNKAVSDLFKQAMQKLAAKRPTGRPFRSHKERAEFNHANWLLEKHMRDAKSQMRKWHLQQIAAAKKAALNGSKQADETAILNSPFLQHAADFKSQFKSFMSSNPTGRPKDLNKAVFDLFKQAKQKLAAKRPTGRPFRSHKERAEFNHANWLLDKHMRDATNRLRRWHLQQIAAARKAALNGSKQADETAIVDDDKFMALANSFKKTVHKKLASVPAEAPNPRDYFKFISDQFELTKKEMIALVTDEQQKSFAQAYQRLLKYQYLAQEKVRVLVKQN